MLKNCMPQLYLLFVKMNITNALTIYLDRCILKLPHHSHYSQSWHEPGKQM